MKPFIGKNGTRVKKKIQAGGMAMNKLNAIAAALSFKLAFNVC